MVILRGGNYLLFVLRAGFWLSWRKFSVPGFTGLFELLSARDLEPLDHALVLLEGSYW